MKGYWASVYVINPIPYSDRIDESNRSEINDSIKVLLLNFIKTCATKTFERYQQKFELFFKL